MWQGHSLISKTIETSAVLDYPPEARLVPVRVWPFDVLEGGDAHRLKFVGYPIACR